MKVAVHGYRAGKAWLCICVGVEPPFSKSWIRHCLVVATRKAFDVTSIYKSLFRRKCTVAAARNWSVHVFSSIENIWKNFYGAISCLFTGQLKRFLLY